MPCAIVRILQIVVEVPMIILMLVVFNLWSLWPEI